ncbi:hypothetical protein BOX15_Mlig003050g4, partial [Macrostomum lignano]
QQQEDSKQLVPQLRARIAALESELKSAKQKLEELRRAKSTVLVKREREVLQVGLPFSGGVGGASSSSTTTVAKVTPKSITAAPTVVNPTDSGGEDNANTDDIIAALKARIDQLEDENTALLSNQTYLETLHNELLTQLSVKEAQLVEAQEHFQRKAEETFSEKYAQWMQGVEAKMAELSHDNAVLRARLASEGSAPDGASTS